MMFVPNTQLEDLRKQHGPRFIDGLIKLSSMRDPIRGIWIDERKYAIAIESPAKAIAQAHPNWTYDRGPVNNNFIPKDALVFNIGATGLGDAIGGLYAACGMADATGRKVIYYAHSANWLTRISHPNVEIRPRVADRRLMGVDGCFDDAAGGAGDYAEQIAHAKSRVQAYCDKLALRLKIRPFSGIRPAEIDYSNPGQFDNPTIMIAPFCAYDSRDWNKYRELTIQLESAGMSVYAIGNGDQVEKLRRTLGPTRAVYTWGSSPSTIIGLMLAAKLVIANDSGIAHLGGLFNVPTISIHAGTLPHKFLFDLAPSVQSVVAPGNHPRSDHHTGLLDSIPVEAVLRVVHEMYSLTPVQRPTIPSLGQVKSYVKAQLSAKRVPLEVAEARFKICCDCQFVQVSKAGEKYCGIGGCGCNVTPKGGLLKSLTEVEENLPEWGCKHPRRGPLFGWPKEK